MNETNCGIINIKDRRTIDLTGITAVDSFDEYSITLSVSCGKLMVEGEKLKISVLDLDKGIVSADGMITAVSYYDNTAGGDRKIFSNFFGRK